MRVNWKRPERQFRLPVTAVKTYQVLAPESTHWRSATCAEAGCLSYTQGWRVRLEKLTPAEEYAVRHSGRKSTEVSFAEGTTYLVFEPGQECFKSFEHMLPIGRPGLYVVRDGDPWRGNPRGTQTRVHTKPDFWVEDFANHQQKLYDRWKRG